MWCCVGQDTIHKHGEGEEESQRIISSLWPCGGIPPWWEMLLGAREQKVEIKLESMPCLMFVYVYDVCLIVKVEIRSMSSQEGKGVVDKTMSKMKWETRTRAIGYAILFRRILCCNVHLCGYFKEVCFEKEEGGPNLSKSSYKYPPSGRCKKSSHAHNIWIREKERYLREWRRSSTSFMFLEKVSGCWEGLLLHRGRHGQIPKIRKPCNRPFHFKSHAITTYLAVEVLEGAADTAVPAGRTQYSSPPIPGHTHSKQTLDFHSPLP